MEALLMRIKKDFYHQKGSKLLSSVNMASQATNAQENMAEKMTKHGVLEESRREGAAPLVMHKGGMLISPFTAYKDWLFYHGERLPGRAEGGEQRSKPGLAVRTEAQGKRATDLGWEMVSMSYVPPDATVFAPPAVAIEESERTHQTEIRAFLHAFGRFAPSSGSGAGMEDNVGHFGVSSGDSAVIQDEEEDPPSLVRLVELFAAIPDDLKRCHPAGQIGGGDGGGDRGTGQEDEVRVPDIIDLKSLTTAGDVFLYVEGGGGGGGSPMLEWAGAGTEWAQQRKKKWGTRTTAEGKKMSDILAAYCFLRFSKVHESVKLDSGGAGNKQILKRKACGLLGRSEGAGDFGASKDISLAATLKNDEGQDVDVNSDWFVLAKCAFALRSATATET